MPKYSELTRSGEADYEKIGQRLNKYLDYKNVKDYNSFKTELIRSSRDSNQKWLTNFFKSGGSKKLFDTEAVQKAMSTHKTGEVRLIQKQQKNVSIKSVKEKHDWSNSRRRKGVTVIEEEEEESFKDFKE